MTSIQVLVDYSTHWYQDEKHDSIVDDVSILMLRTMMLSQVMMMPIVLILKMQRTITAVGEVEDLPILLKILVFQNLLVT